MDYFKIVPGSNLVIKYLDYMILTNLDVKRLFGSSSPAAGSAAKWGGQAEWGGQQPNEEDKASRHNLETAAEGTHSYLSPLALSGQFWACTVFLLRKEANKV